MKPENEEPEVGILSRWKRRVEYNSDLGEEVKELASRIRSGAQLFVEERQHRLVERILMDAALVPVSFGRPIYVS